MPPSAPWPNPKPFEGVQDKWEHKDHSSELRSLISPSKLLCKIPWWTFWSVGGWAAFITHCLLGYNHQSLSLGCSAHHSLLFILHHKPYIKGCGKVPLSSWNKCSLGFGAGKRRQHAKQTSEVIFLLLWWDTVCLILVFWKLHTLSKLLIKAPSTVKDNTDASKWEFMPSSLAPP